MTTIGGLHHDITAAEYHADPCGTPSLSSSVARILIDKTPAHARLAHPRLNQQFGSVSNRAMDIGSVAHELVLGRGAGFEISPYDTYNSKAAKEWRDDTLASGLTPIKAKEHAAAKRMADSIAWMADAIAFQHGHAESVVIWEDAIAGTLCRAMIDWYDPDRASVFDLKTTGLGLSDRALQKMIAGGLDLQAAFHLRGLGQATGNDNIAWHWVFVENEEPHECRIIEMDATTRAFGNRKAECAIQLWTQCLAHNAWPGYPREVQKLGYPAWAESSWLEREAAESGT